MSDDQANKNVICVFGAGRIRAGSPAYARAQRVGAVLAGLGYAVATGGYGGIMEAVSRGANQAGARVIGVTCRLWRSRPNRFVTEIIDTADLHARVARLVELGGAGYVVLPGGTGTLVELATVWELAAKGRLARRAVVCVGDAWRPLAELMARPDPAATACLRFVHEPDDLSEHFPPRGAAT